MGSSRGWRRYGQTTEADWSREEKVVTILRGDFLRDLGVLQEANRTFFHPIGMELRANPDGECSVVLCNAAPLAVNGDGVQACPALSMDNEADVVEKAERVRSLLAANAGIRAERFGGSVQQLPEQDSGSGFEVARLLWLSEQLGEMIQAEYVTEPLPGMRAVHRCELVPEEVEAAKRGIARVEGLGRDGLAGMSGEDRSALLRDMELLFSLGQPGMGFFRGDERSVRSFEANRESIMRGVEEFRSKLSEADQYMSGGLLPSQVRDVDGVAKAIRARLDAARSDREREMYSVMLGKLIW